MNLSELDGYIWYDGNIVDWKEAQTHVLTYTLHYGLGVFEGVRAYSTPKGTCIFRLHDHTERLFKSANTIGMKIPFSSDELIKAQAEVVRLNNLEESYIRPMCFYGSEGLGKRQAGNEVANAKINGNYVQSTVALNEALEQGFEETLMLDSDGFVAEGSGENFFMVKGNLLISPDLNSCLDGITRKTIISLAKELDIDFEERKIKLEEVFESDEAFFTGTAAEVVPINSLDNKSIADGLRGPVTEKLQKAYLDQVRGKRTENQDWHTPVNS